MTLNRLSAHALVALPLAAVLLALAPVRQGDVKTTYTRLCASCHGPEGLGDGPAVVALDPKPASFADSAFQAARSDSQLTASIASGKGMMPGFEKQLSPEQIRALVAYVRSLGSPAKKP